MLAEAGVTQSPPSIELHWPLRNDVSQYRLTIRKPDATESVQILPGTATGYLDTNVTVGSGYEYRIRATRTFGSVPSSAFSNIYASVDLAPVETRGRVILVTDQRVEAALKSELGRWEQDTSNSGWAVERLSVAPQTLPVDIRNAIRAKAAAWPPGTEGAVFLFGHIPVPYSGNIYPDGHTEHRGAWPCDAYYGELDSQWSDNILNNVAAVRTENWNVSADRKFDSSTLPSAVELMVGRVDFFNLPAFIQSETELLRRYLNKEHAFRCNQLTVQRRAVLDDNFASILSEAPSSSARFAMAGLVGAAGMVSDEFVSSTQLHPSLIGLGAGFGDYQTISGACSTSDCVLNPPQILFSLVFGSYFGDFDSQNNVMRSLLAADNCTLAAGWTGRPQWQMHHLAMNFPLGFSARLTQNSASAGSYNTGFFAKSTHLALMGDPTLCLFNSEPVSNVTESNGTISWTAPTVPALLGCHVYRAPTPTGPWTRQNVSLLTSSSWTDPSPAPGSHYLVRAVHRETTASGSFLNVSIGVLATPVAETVAIRVVEPQGKEYPLQPAIIRIERIGHGAALDVSLFAPQGTATEGQDFVSLARTVTIPAGASFVDLEILPIADNSKEGAETVTLNIASAGGATIDASHSNAAVEIADHPWQAWCTNTFPTRFAAFSGAPHLDESPTGDPDKDGFNNLMEFALGTNPLVANSESLFSASEVTPYVCTAKYTRASKIAGLEWRVESTKDFVNWTLSPPNIMETVTSGPNNTETSELKLPMNETRNFIRLKLMAAPGFFP